MYDPCSLCGDRYCCRQMCKDKQTYRKETGDLKFKNNFGPPKPMPKFSITTNKNGIRKEVQG